MRWLVGRSPASAVLSFLIARRLARGLFYLSEGAERAGSW